MTLGNARVLIVGMGGLGSPVALVLARAGVKHFTLVDDDVVQTSNLHRQILFTDADVGAAKVERAEAKLRALVGDDLRITLRQERLVPENALDIVGEHDLVCEGADNLATKFLVADACARAGRTVVHAGVVRWSGWAMLAVPGQSACLRCVFEDLPGEHVETCAEAGVIGSVVGVVAALQAGLALEALHGNRDAPGTLWSFRAKDLVTRKLHPARRQGCELCAGHTPELHIERYAPQQHVY